MIRLRRPRGPRRLLALVGVALAAVLVACGSDRGGDAATSTTAPSTSPASPTAPTTTAPPTTTMPPPSTPPEFTAAVEALRTSGRDVVSLLLVGDVDALYARATPAFRAAVPIEEGRRVLEELTATAPIGDRRAERAMPTGPSGGIYVAEHGWGPESLQILVLITADGVEVSLEPTAPLPPDPVDPATVSNRVRLPFDGTWYVGASPTQELGNHHQAASDQRHAYDFVIWRDGATYRTDGTTNEDHWAWGRPVLAPAAATVITAVDGIPDNRPHVETNAAQPAGNHVVLDLGDGEYAIIAHFQQGTVRVAVGDQVRAGDVLGLTGNSGNSSEPHIHVHIQDAPEFEPGGSNGIPARFEHVVADGVALPLGPAPADAFVFHGG